MGKNRSRALEILAYKRRKEQARALVQELDKTFSDPEGHLKRPALIVQLRRYLTLDGSTGVLVQSALQRAYAHDQRHWSEWDKDPRDIDRYVGYTPDDDYYIEILPGGYYRFDDGEIMGFRQLREILTILEAKETHVRGDIEFRAPAGQTYELPWSSRTSRTIELSGYNPNLHAAYNTRVGWEPEDAQPDDDRGSEPEGFKPDYEVDWDEVAGWLFRLGKDLKYVREALIRWLHELSPNFFDRQRKWLKKLLGTHVGTHVPDVPFSLILPPMPDHTRHYVIRAFVKRTLKDADIQDDDILEWLTEKLAQRWGFAQDFELPEYDGVDRHALSEAQRVDDDYLEQAINAPIIRIKSAQLADLQEKLPHPKRVIVTRKGNVLEYRLRFDADWETLLQLLALAGEDIDPRTSHTRTPAFQCLVIRAITNGADIKSAYAAAWEEYRKLRKQVPMIIDGVENDHALAEKGGRAIQIHLSGLDFTQVALDEEQQRLLLQHADKHPHLGAAEFLTV